MASLILKIAVIGFALARADQDHKCKSLDDDSSLLQQTSNLGVKGGASVISTRDPALGGSTAIIPPVGVSRKVGSVSTPGSWKNYYKMAETSMDEQWPKIYSMIQGSRFGQVLEVAAGACRNTVKLAPLSTHILVTDIDPTAVKSCEERFANSPERVSKFAFAVVDGVHIPTNDESIDTIYQFDSGVHFHPQVIRGYLKEFQRVLVPGGTGFFHHSNLAASQFPVVDGADVTQNQAWRSNMSRALFQHFAHEAGLEMLCHPLVNWAGSANLDAFARFRKPGGETRTQQETCPLHLDF